MRKIYVWVLFLCFLGNTMLSGQVKKGPVTKTDTLIGFQDIIVMYNECGDEGGFIQHGLRLNPDYATADNAFSVIDFDTNTYIRSGTVPKMKSGVIRNIGQKDAWFAAWNKQDSLFIKTYYSEEIQFQDSIWKLKDTLSKFPDMQLVKGNNMLTADFQGNGTINLVTVYSVGNEQHLAIFTFKAGLVLAYESGYTFPVDLKNLVGLTVNDFDNDNRDEIIITYVSGNEIYLQAFDVTAGYTIVPYDAQKIEGVSAPRIIENLEITSGDFDADGDPEIAMAYGMPNPCSINYPVNNNGNCEDIRLYTFEVEDDPVTPGMVDPLEVFSYDTLDGIKLNVETGNDDNVSPLNLLAGNILNDDGNTVRDELVLGAYSVFLFQADDDLKVHEEEQFMGTKTDYSSVNQFISIANLDGLGTSSIIIVDNYFETDAQPYFKVQAIDYTVDNNIINQTNILPSPQINCGRNYTIVSGFFSGLYFKILGNPEYISWKKMVRPVVVMNTPPAHFDLINGEVHDVNRCFGTNECRSSLKYLKTDEVVSETGMITSSQGDWGFNTRLTGNVDIKDPVTSQSWLGVSGIDISKLLGEDLGDVTTTTLDKETETFRFKVSEMQGRFSRDDAMLALVSDYDKWVYTVTGNNGDTLGDLVIVLTTADEKPTWIEGRESMILAGYIPTHEQSNFLSYRSATITSSTGLKYRNPDIREMIAVGNSKSVNVNSQYNEEVSWEKVFKDENVIKKNKVESNPSYFAGIPFLGGVNISDGSIAKEETITSHTYEISDGMSLSIEGYGTEANVYSYSFIPYYYWSKSGALVIDYMLDLSGNNFWLENYGVENPGFLFMNRLDSLKVRNSLDLITDMDEYNKTTSIFTLPVFPKSGEIIHVGALIHNLSLENTSDKIAVKFYLGNPNDGGVELADTSGKTIFYTDDIIEYQGFKPVSMVWKSHFDINDRIYCVIDPENLIAENNEDDNIGWAPINRLTGYDQGGTTDLKEDDYQFGDLSLRMDIFPNPASEYVTLNYTGPDFEQGTLSIVNLKGQQLWSIPVTSQKILTGNRNIDIGNLPVGMYFMVLETENYRQQSKFLVK